MKAQSVWIPRLSVSRVVVLALGFGLWPLGSGLWALGLGPWAVGCGLWALGSNGEHLGLDHLNHGRQFIKEMAFHATTRGLNCYLQIKLQFAFFIFRNYGQLVVGSSSWPQMMSDRYREQERERERESLHTFLTVNAI